MAITKELNVLEIWFRNVLNELFYSKNDVAHQIDHIDEVWLNACDLINDNGIIGIDRTILFFGIYLHDIFSGVDRKNHNLLAGYYILDYGYREHSELKILDYLSDFERKIIVDMILFHRSSINIKDYKPSDPSRYQYVNLIRAADKGAPIFSEYLERSLNFNGGDIENVKKHFIEKFSEDGYAWENDPMYKELYRNEYEIFQKELKEWLEGH